jgi:hypothetical protein
MTKIEENNEFYLQKEISLKSYINIYLKSNISKIKNLYKISEEVLLPEEWKITDPEIQTKYDNLIKKNDLHKKFVSIAEVNTRTFDTIFELVNGMSKNINILKGKQLVYSCSKQQLLETQFDFKNVSSLLHYVFIKILSSILEIQESSSDLDLLSGVTMEEKCPEDIDEDDEDSLDITRELEKTHNIESMLVLEIIKNIETDSKYIQKHSKSYIQSVIEQKAETDKESNLKFIQELDKETWASLKTMISLGMDTWKNLSNKTKDVYVGSDPIGDEDTTTPQEDENTLRLQAQQELGGDFTADQYENWKQNREANEAEDRLAYEERDIMEDDDETLE